MVDAQRRSRDIRDDRVDELGETKLRTMARIRETGEKTCHHFRTRVVDAEKNRELGSSRRQHDIDTHGKRGKSVGGGHERRELEVEACLDEAKESLPKTMTRYKEPAHVFAEHFRSRLEGALEKRLDEVVI